jgi:acyl-CoA thioester hydrolase
VRPVPAGWCAVPRQAAQRRFGDRYATYFLNHRMAALREDVGWDMKTLGTLPFMVWVRRIEIDFVRRALGDQEITITSFTREFVGSDAFVECTMRDFKGKTVSRCVMIVAYVDKATQRAAEWPAEVASLFFEEDGIVHLNCSPDDPIDRAQIRSGRHLLRP